MKFEQLAESALPVKPNKIWCISFIGKNKKDHTNLIVLALSESLVQLQVGEQITNFTDDIGFTLNKKTLLIEELYDGNTIVGYL